MESAVSIGLLRTTGSGSRTLGGQKSKELKIREFSLFAHVEIFFFYMSFPPMRIFFTVLRPQRSVPFQIAGLINFNSHNRLEYVIAMIQLNLD